MPLASLWEKLYLEHRAVAFSGGLLETGELRPVGLGGGVSVGRAAPATDQGPQLESKWGAATGGVGGRKTAPHRRPQVEPTRASAAGVTLSLLHVHRQTHVHRSQRACHTCVKVAAAAAQTPAGSTQHTSGLRTVGSREGGPTGGPHVHLWAPQSPRKDAHVPSLALSFPLFSGLTATDD